MAAKRTDPLLPLNLTASQVTQALNICQRTLDRLVAAGKIKPVHYGKRALRFRRRDVERLAETGWKWKT